MVLAPTAQESLGYMHYTQTSLRKVPYIQVLLMLECVEVCPTPPTVRHPAAHLKANPISEGEELGAEFSLPCLTEFNILERRTRYR